MTELKTSSEWCRNLGAVITDPDGWDRDNYQWSFYDEKISYAEFMARLAKSTTIKISKDNRRV